MKTFLPLTSSSRARRVFALVFALAAPLAAVQISGCGGGGGGGGGGLGFQETEVTVTFQLTDENGNSADGTVTLRQGSTDRTQQSINQEAVFTNVKSGNYTVLFTINSVTTLANVSVATDASQTFQLISGNNSVPNQGISISGIVRLNPTTGNVALCTANSSPITSRLVIRVRDANQSDQPIVASAEKPKQTSNNIPANQRGTFRVANIPGPGTYFIEVVSAAPTAGDPTPGQFTGRGPIFTIAQGQTSISGVEICANAGTFAVGDVP